MPDQEYIHAKCLSEEVKDRQEAVVLLATNFSSFPNRLSAWQELINLTQDEDNDVRELAVYLLGEVFSHVPDKEQAWQDLIKLTQDKDSRVREFAAYAIGKAFSDIPDREQAWQYLIKFNQDEERDVREMAIYALAEAFNYIPDKGQAWQYLIKFTQDNDIRIREISIEALGKAFNHVQDKEQAWQDLIKFTTFVDSGLRGRSIGVLGEIFNQAPDKEELWQDLIKFAKDDDGYVQWKALSALEKAVNHNPDKEQAWQDLVRLIQDSDGLVQLNGVDILRNVFGYVLDKGQAWQDLIRLTQEDNAFLRFIVVGVLGEVISLVPGREQAWQDLTRFTQDKDSDVRMHAYYSLGRASVVKAIEANDLDTLKRELETTVIYFEKSSLESSSSPAKFCHLFYRTYLAITFQGAKDDEVQRYLIEVKNIVGNSKSKGELIKVVENLAKALQKAQSLKDRPLYETASELEACRWYCEKAAEHMALIEERVPRAVKLMRRCNPLLEERIQITITEIQKIAGQICQATHGSGTAYEAPGAEINKAAKALSSGDIVSMQKCSARIVGQLGKLCNLLSEDEKGPICEVVEEIEHGVGLPERLSKIELALSYLKPIFEDNLKSSIEQGEIIGLLKNIEFNTSKLSISSGDTKRNLFDLQSDIKSLQNMIEGQGQNITQLDTTLKEIDQADIEIIEKVRKELIQFIERTTIQSRSTDEKALEILNKIKGMEQIKVRDCTSIVADIIQIGSYLNWLLGFPIH